jgi:hypothetical protein
MAGELMFIRAGGVVNWLAPNTIQPSENPQGEFTMSWREDLKVGKCRIDELYLGTDNGGLGTQVTATAAELNALDGVTASVGELNLNDNMWNSVSTAATPASGSCGVQFTFKDVAGTTMATSVTGMFYVSNVATGLNSQHANLTALATLTNGIIIPTQNFGGTQAGPGFFTTTAAGLLGMTLTGSVNDYYVIFQHPTGKLVASTVCTINS